MASLSTQRSRPRVPRPTRTLLADPHGLVIEALRALLPADHLVVGVAADGETLVHEALRLQPDLVLLEVHLPRLDGLEAVRRIRARNAEVHCVFLTAVEDEGLAAEAFAAGASGYLLKTGTGAELVAGLRSVARRGTVLSRRIADGRPEHLSRRPSSAVFKPHLSARAGEVVRLVAEGLAMKEIAARLGIATRTVAFHKYRAMDMLGIGSSAGLVRFAVEAGMLEPPSQPASSPTWGARSRARPAPPALVPLPRVEAEV